MLKNTLFRKDIPNLTAHIRKNNREPFKVIIEKCPSTGQYVAMIGIFAASGDTRSKALENLEEVVEGQHDLDTMGGRLWTNKQRKDYGIEHLSPSVVLKQKFFPTKKLKKLVSKG